MIQPGQIFKVPLTEDDGITPKGGYEARNKYCVVIATPDYGLCVAYLVVNHAINKRFNVTKQLIDNFYPLDRKDYPEFIKPEFDPSWIDLNRVREMEAGRMECYGPPVGILTERDLKLIRETIAANDFAFTLRQRRRWGLL